MILEKSVKSKLKTRYKCDRCGKEISEISETENKVYVQESNAKIKKLCDLCDKCYRSLKKRN